MRPPKHCPANHTHEGALIWTVDDSAEAISSAPVRGGRSQPNWVANVRVPLDYSRTDLETHAAEIAAAESCDGKGIVLFTAASISRRGRAERDGATVDATVGVTKPTWAADESGGHQLWAPGTINIVASVPAALSEAAAVNLVMTITEAKTQALIEHGIPGTGTASDAVVVLWQPDGESEDFGGPRSRWGSQVALATHEAVQAAIPR